MSPLTCDGCGHPADAEHIAERFRRLELATKYRPIHIGVLFLAEAPPQELTDFFYLPESEGSCRRVDSHEFFEAMMRGLGISGAEWRDDAARLAEFQHRGYFLTYATECPFAGGKTASQRTLESGLVAPLSDTLLKRIRLSLRPKQILLLGRALDRLIPLLRDAGWSDRLLLRGGAPLELPRVGDAAAYDRFASCLAALTCAPSANASAI